MKLGLKLGLDSSRFSGVSYDVATQAALDHAASQGDAPASGSALTALDTLLSTFRAEGILDKLDLLYVFATNGDRNFAKYNVISPGTYDCTENGALTFTSLEGFSGNGTTGYLNTNWNPNGAAGIYSKDNASIGAYVRSFGNMSNSAILMGMRTGANNNTTALSHRANSATVLISGVNNDTGADLSTLSHSTETGFMMASRSASTGYSIYENGTPEASVTRTSNAALTSENMYIGAFNGGSATAVSFCTAQFSIAFVGADLSAEALIMFTAIETYLDSIGKGVVS